MPRKIRRCICVKIRQTSPTNAPPGDLLGPPARRRQVESPKSRIYLIFSKYPGMGVQKYLRNIYPKFIATHFRQKSRFVRAIESRYSVRLTDAPPPHTRTRPLAHTHHTPHIIQTTPQDTRHTTLTTPKTPHYTPRTMRHFASKETVRDNATRASLALYKKCILMCKYQLK